MAGLDEEARLVRLRALQSALVERLSTVASAGDFFAQGHQLIDDLRALGHDLWSFDSDGENFEIWCGDWKVIDGGGPLTITFRYPVEVEVAWREAG